jgi:hypothetical protein
MKIEDAIGKRCLIRKSADWFGKPREVMILELSPSREYVKFKYTKTVSFAEWIRIKNLKLLEILDD